MEKDKSLILNSLTDILPLFGSGTAVLAFMFSALDRQTQSFFNQCLDGGPFRHFCVLLPTMHQI
jgi:hypothetical protein